MKNRKEPIMGRKYWVFRKVVRESMVLAWEMYIQRLVVEVKKPKSGTTDI